MTAHAKDSLGSARITQILNLPFAIATPETAGAEGLVASEDGQVFDLVAAGIAAICAVVADEGAVAEEEKVCVGVEQRAACVTPETVDVPSVASWEGVSGLPWVLEDIAGHIPSSKALPSSSICAKDVSDHA